MRLVHYAYHPLAGSGVNRSERGKSMSRRLGRITTATALAATFALGGVGAAQADSISSGNDGQKCTPEAIKSNVKGNQSSGYVLGSYVSEWTLWAQHRGEYVHNFVRKYSKCYPDYNVLVIQEDTPKSFSVQGISTVDKVKVPPKDYKVFVFKTGEVTNKGDLGWANWGWSGKNWDRSNNNKTVTFGPR